MNQFLKATQEAIARNGVQITYKKKEIVHTTLIRV